MDANDDFYGKELNFLHAYNFWTKIPQNGYSDTYTLNYEVSKNEIRRTMKCYRSTQYYLFISRRELDIHNEKENSIKTSGTKRQQQT